VVDRRGRVIGRVTSCAIDKEGYLLGQAYLELAYTEPDSPIGIFQGGYDGSRRGAEIGDRLAVPTPATVLTRFPR
jgi:glycine hydroxymethyltransferase